GVVISAFLMAVLVTYGARKLPELNAHLSIVSSLRIGRWWRVLIAVVVPIMLAVMVVTALQARLSEPYEGYPWTFITIAGWGTLGLMVVVAVALSLVRWRRPVDDFTPERVPTTEGAGR